MSDTTTMREALSDSRQRMAQRQAVKRAPIVRLARLGASVEQIARSVGVAESTVRTVFRQERIPPPGRGP